MTNLSIKIKLIIIFIAIKIIPLVAITFIAYEGVLKLDLYLKDSTQYLHKQSKNVIMQTANASIDDSIKNLDKKSQISIERLSSQVAKNIAEFLYQRDSDILFLSTLQPNQKLYENFFKSKTKDIIIHDKYYYDDSTNSWKTKELNIKKQREQTTAILIDNKKEFKYVDPIHFQTKNIPIYKEIVYFNTKGQEIYKVSKLNKHLQDISDKKNRYINAETYYEEIDTLKKGEIYVSDVIGEYIPSKVIGTFTKEKAKKMNMEFKPENHAYAGKENPVGKKFEGIIRFITPIYKNGKKTGYISLALDHEHIMQYTDTINPTSEDSQQNIADASIGNYAFMWDAKGRNISHPRDYFIVGYDKKTGQRVMPWLSADLANKFKQSKQNINDFLKSYPTFEDQSLDKKPNIEQLKKDGYLGLDCRYLNFAPQCQGWMQVTQNGGYGSFVIYWSKVWKLSTAATIPYYTGKYKDSKRGFGFVTIGANVDEFHSAANKTKENVSIILETQTNEMKEIVQKNKLEIESFIKNLINELTVVTVIMITFIILIALWLSDYLSTKIHRLLVGTSKFADNELDYRIEITSNDEIGKLEKSFNTMAKKISHLIDEEKKVNESLEIRVKKELSKSRQQEQLLIQQSRYAAMGEMIGNIAHQWRQPLNALSLLLQNIENAYDMDLLDAKYIEKTIKKGDMLTSNMSKTIDDFRNFFIKNKDEEIFKFSDVLNSTMDIIKPSLEASQIQIIEEIDDTVTIKGFQNEFSQVLINILSNAKDALVSSKKENRKLFIKIYKKDEYSYISIEDNAGGISPDILDKIFDPYFTTKDEGDGTGIGLYMSKTIIENHMNGKLYAQNQNDGASFTICI